MAFDTKDGTVISRLELVLPKNVLQTCISLQKGFATEFLSTNFQKRTTSRIKVTKEIDESVRLTVSVSKLPPEDPARPEHILIHGLKEKAPEKTPSQTQNLSNLHNNAVNKKSQYINEDSNSEEINTIDPHSISKDTTITDLISNPIDEQQLSKRHMEEESQTRTSITADKSHTILEHSKNEQLDKCDDASVLPGCERDNNNLSPLCPMGGNVDDILKSICVTELRKSAEQLQKEDEARKAGCANIRLSDENEFNNKSGIVESEPPRDNKVKLDKSPSSSIQTRSMRFQRQSMALSDTNAIHKEGENNSECDGCISKEGQDKPTVLKIKETTLRQVGIAKKNPNVDRSKMKRPHYKREQNVQCSFCPVKLKDLDSLFDHAKLKHAHMKGYKQLVAKLRETMKVTCDVCNKVYSRRDQLTVHMNLVHTTPKAVDCPKCRVRVKSERHLKDHVRRIHSNTERVNLCHLCPASFKVPAYLSAHLKYVHTSNREDAFPCDECEKTYSSEKYLRNHKMRVHTSKRYACGVCGKAFSTHPNLRRHIMLLHEKKGDKPFQCEVCGRRFTLKANWKDHVNTLHLNSYSLQCSVCELGFRRKKDLRSHEANAHGSLGRPIMGLRQLSLSADGRITVIPACSTPCSGGSVELRPHKTDMNVQYIMATPEILQTFGIQHGDIESDAQKLSTSETPVLTFQQSPVGLQENVVVETVTVETVEVMAEVEDSSDTLTIVTDMDIAV